MWRRSACLLLALALGCERETPRAEASAAPSATASAAPSARPAEAPAAKDALAPRPKPRGKVVRFEPPPNAAVVLASDSGELRILGVDGRALGWRTGDPIVADGPTPDATTLDCTDATRCSLGLESGGDIVLRDIDAHSAIHLLSLSSANAIVVGASRRASLELRAERTDQTLRALGAAFGLGIERVRNLTLLAPPAVLAKLDIPTVAVPSRNVDLHLVGAPLGDVTRLFANVSKRELTGKLTGQISAFVHETPSIDVLSAYLALCGIRAQPSAAGFSLTQTGDACSKHRAPRRRCPVDRDAPLRAVRDDLACFPVSELRVLAVALPKRRPAGAVLGVGTPHGDEIPVRVGTFLGQHERLRTKDGEVQVHWRVDEIARDRVELVLEDPDSTAAPRRVKLDFE